MRDRILLAVFGLALCGCSVPSLHPLYMPSDIIFDDRLLGEWSLPDGDLRVTLKKGAANDYDVEIRNEDGRRRYTGHLVKLGAGTFFSIYPQEAEAAAGLIAAHSIYRVSIEGKALRFGGLREPALRDLLAQRKVTAPYTTFRAPGDREDRLLLTGSTHELQRLVTDLAGMKDAFYDSRLVRR